VIAIGGRIPQKTISNIVDSGKNRQVSEFTKTFTLIVYNIWKKFSNHSEINLSKMG
jgi:hypothetical protein